MEGDIKKNKKEISLIDYKKEISERISKITPILQKVAMGDFSQNVTIPEKEDEFTEFLASLNLMIDDLRELTNLEEYKRETVSKLSILTPILQKVAMGDFSQNVTIPEKEDEFTELLASLNLMIDDLRELTEIQKRAKEEVEDKVKERTKELEESRRALINMLEDVEEARSVTEEEKNRTLTIIENFTDGLLLFDEENKLSLINPKAEKMLKILSKDTVNKSTSELINIPELKLLIEFIETGNKKTFREELTIREGFLIEVTTVPIAQDEERVGNLVILHDVSREKLVEQMKTEFVSLAAHQLRTPLSAIKWTLKMLLEGDLGEITKEQRDFIEKTYQSNERMINLINDLLDVTRIEEGRYLFKTAPADIEALVQFVLKSYKETIDRKKLKVIFRRPKERMPNVNVDVEKVKIVFQNFLDNAIRYSPLGGIVTVSLRCVKKEIEVAVKDNGIGVPKDQQERVFSKFFRAANVMRVDTEGSGLGLFISRNIIEAHGGRIWFESKEGRGATFFFSLPLKEEFVEFLKKV